LHSFVVAGHHVHGRSAGTSNASRVHELADFRSAKGELAASEQVLLGNVLLQTGRATGEGVQERLALFLFFLPFI